MGLLPELMSTQLYGNLNLYIKWEPLNMRLIAPLSIVIAVETRPLEKNNDGYSNTGRARLIRSST